ncbi:general stress protein [Tengunoibacter tsumagoiensis]|uniref:Uncharacterized protein n=1 Tax=Tengunoibacter tsumagoiensis TaxID=2014871 RepID=A0A402A3L4_9CHLR|nr:general stress protein [Tengunoibacter tsumagoiensis]GCE13639.1 hypothetical protein KTT_34980 [Tengunoibacter tsumagoiensis]
MSEKRVVVGVFADNSQVEKVIQELRILGLQEDQIGVLVHNEEDLKQVQGDAQKTVLKDDKSKTGAVAGGLVGGVLGATFSLLIPGGSSTAMAVGKALTSAAGGAALGATAGGLLGKLLKAGVPEEDAPYYEHELKAGHIVVIAQAEKQPLEIYHIFEQNQASSVRPLAEEEDPESTIKLKAQNTTDTQK